MTLVRVVMVRVAFTHTGSRQNRQECRSPPTHLGAPIGRARCAQNFYTIADDNILSFSLVCIFTNRLDCDSCCCCCCCCFFLFFIIWDALLFLPCPMDREKLFACGGGWLCCEGYTRKLHTAVRLPLEKKTR